VRLTLPHLAFLGPLLVGVRKVIARAPFFLGGGAAIALLAVGGWCLYYGEETTTERRSHIPLVVVPVAGFVATQPQAPETPNPLAEPPQPGQIVQAAATAPPRRPDPPVVLAPAPSPGLIEESRFGPLPRIGADGRTPWQVYARPFPAAETRPRIAIIMADLGLSGATTGLAIQKLPGGVTLAFAPFSERIDTWVEKARADGHEVLLNIPMEPRTYPRDDPGPNTLLTTLSVESNIERLEWAMARVSGFIGVTSVTGSKFLESGSTILPILEDVKKRGLLFLDARATGSLNAAHTAAQLNIPRAGVDRQIDSDPARTAIDDQLRALEEIAKRNGVAVGLALPFPTTIERLSGWLPGLGDKGLVLAPLSAVVNLQKFE